MCVLALVLRWGLHVLLLSLTAESLLASNVLALRPALANYNERTDQVVSSYKIARKIVDSRWSNSWAQGLICAKAGVRGSVAKTGSGAQSPTLRTSNSDVELFVSQSIPIYSGCRVRLVGHECMSATSQSSLQHSPADIAGESAGTSAGMLDNGTDPIKSRNSYQAHPISYLESRPCQTLRERISHHLSGGDSPPSCAKKRLCRMVQDTATVSLSTAVQVSPSLFRCT
jgi:hypothetical protein